MKLKTSILAALAVTSLAQVASADVTIDITGATAFRQAAVESIRAVFTSVPNYGWSGTAGFGGANLHIFKGNTSLGATTIRCAWSGSTEGARSAIFDVATSYFPDNGSLTLTTAGAANLSTSGAVTANNHDIYFSDTAFSKTIYSTYALLPAEAAEVSGLVQTQVGAIVFTPLKNETSAAFLGLTNVTQKNFAQLYSGANAGRMRLSQFTGLNADDNSIVYATGRSDLSGTRTSYMLESLIGPATPITQWKVQTTAGNAISEIRLWPTGDNTPGNDNRSVQWTNADTTLPSGYPTAGVEIPGNGGYFSGSVLRGVMDDTSSAVTVTADNGDVIEGPVDVALITYLANSDAATAIASGAVALNWNGVGITPNSAGLSAVDKAKIQNGLYTAWNYENINLTGAANSDELTIFNAIVGQIQANIGSAGLTLAEMAGVERAEDGGLINIAYP